MDERQIQIQGKITRYGVIGTIVVLMLLAFLNDLKIFVILDYIEFGDLMIILCLSLVTFLSLGFIWKDAYFGPSRKHQARTCLIVFTVLMVLEDGLLLADLLLPESLSVVSVFTSIMVNCIAISLWCKRKDW